MCYKSLVLNYRSLPRRRFCVSHRLPTTRSTCQSKAMPVDETSINRTEVNVFCHQFRNCFLEFINKTANEFIFCMNVNDSEANKLKVIHHFDIDCQNIRFCNDICLAKCKFLDSYMMVDMQLKKVRNICINKKFRPFFRV